MSLKSELLRNEPELFEKFMDTTERAKYLNAVVLLCDDSVQVILLVLNASEVKDGQTGIQSVITWHEYDQTTLNGVNAALDARAKVLKDKWKTTFDQLNDVDATDFYIDTMPKDYVKFAYGGDRCTQKIYRLPWSLDSVITIAEYISDHLVPTLDE